MSEEKVKTFEENHLKEAPQKVKEVQQKGIDRLLKHIEDDMIEKGYIVEPQKRDCNPK